MADHRTPSSRILIVEDSRTQATALSLLLEEHGYTTVTVPSGERALSILEDVAFDLVMTDVVMPGIDGYEVCRRIKAMPGRESTPVVLLTSLSDPLDIVRGLEAGAEHYVTKPYDPERLVARVRHVLRRASSPPTATPGRPVTVDLLGIPFTISATKEEILDLLVSSYGDLVTTSEAVRAAERRARFLGEASDRFSQSLDLEHVLRALVSIAVPAIADVVALAQAPPTVVVPPGLFDHTLSAVGARLATRVADTRRTDLITADEANAELSATGLSAVLAVPLTARGNILGVLLLGSRNPNRTYTEQDYDFAEDVARRAALAIDNAMLYLAAQQATQARNDLLAIVSHDLRNPLHTIQMAASFLLDITQDVPANNTTRTQLGAIGRAARRGNALIQDLLDASRIEAGRLSVDIQPVSGAALIDDALTEMTPLGRQVGVELSGAWTGGEVDVAADRERVAQLFANLIGNAIKFTPAGGRVTITGRVRGDVAEFLIADTGPGIPSEQIPRLFDRFWQAKQAGRAGAGLGLFIARGIVEAHGGRLTVESTVGLGSTFMFTLQVGAAAVPAPAVATAARR